MPAIAVVAAVGTWFGAAEVMAAVVGGAIIGAAVGGVVAAVKGENILKGMAIGGLIGAAGGAIGGVVAPEAAAAGSGVEAAGGTLGQAYAAGTADSLAVAGGSGAASADMAMAGSNLAAGVDAAGVGNTGLLAANSAPAGAASTGLTAGEKTLMAGSVLKGASGMLGPDQEELIAAQQKAQKEQDSAVFERNRNKSQAGIVAAPVMKIENANRIQAPNWVNAVNANAVPVQQAPQIANAAQIKRPGLLEGTA